LAYTGAESAVKASLLVGRSFKEGIGRDTLVDIENLTGSRWDDVLTGDHGRNILRGQAGDDRLVGYDGADRLTGGTGNDDLDGGLGQDSAIFSGLRAEYTITTGTNGTIVVRHSVEGGDGTDRLTDIETLVFSDEVLAI
jgi:Ca2+-binding RTX toxin-like protein